MTLDNAKRLYEHYVEIGYNKAAENLLLKYPNFKEVKEEKAEVKVEVKAEKKETIKKKDK